MHPEDTLWYLLLVQIQKAGFLSDVLANISEKYGISVPSPAWTDIAETIKYIYRVVMSVDSREWPFPDIIVKMKRETIDNVQGHLATYHEAYISLYLKQNLGLQYTKATSDKELQENAIMRDYLYMSSIPPLLDDDDIETLVSTGSLITPVLTMSPDHSEEYTKDWIEGLPARNRSLFDRWMDNLSQSDLKLLEEIDGGQIWRHSMAMEPDLKTIEIHVMNPT